MSFWNAVLGGVVGAVAGGIAGGLADESVGGALAGLAAGAAVGAIAGAMLEILVLTIATLLAGIRKHLAKRVQEGRLRKGEVLGAQIQQLRREGKYKRVTIGLLDGRGRQKEELCIRSQEVEDDIYEGQMLMLEH